MSDCDSCKYTALTTREEPCRTCIGTPFGIGKYEPTIPIVPAEAFAAATPPMPETKAGPAQPNLALPEDSATRKEMPMATGLLDYFPAALAEVARVSKKGNDKHNPGQPLHHARGKSMDHPDCIMRHLADRGLFDDQGMRHSANLAWRALALLQQELEDAGLAQPPRGARFSD